MEKQYLIVDNEFNRQWYRDLIGKTVPVPPSYANVIEVEVADDDMTIDELVFGKGIKHVQGL